MRTQLKTLALAGLLLAPAVAMAQAPVGRGAPRGPGGPGAGPRGEMPPLAVSRILNARRALDLTPRQVAQLDSMERALWAERAKLRAQMEPQRDSLRNSVRQQVQRGARPRQDSAARATMRREAEARMARIRPQMQALRQRDSTMRVAAERLLTDAQRGKLREMQAERRGYERARREAGPRGGMRPGMRAGRAGWMAGRMHGGQRSDGRPGAPQGRARPPQRPE